MMPLGEFRKVAPPGAWLHTQLGYELFKWLMLFGEGELAFSDTSNRQDPPQTRAFPIFGFGGGLRVTIRITDRVGIYAQPSAGAMKADIGTNALGLLGFRNAESLGLYVGGRLGVEWYQIRSALRARRDCRRPHGSRLREDERVGRPRALRGRGRVPPVRLLTAQRSRRHSASRNSTPNPATANAPCGWSARTRSATIAIVEAITR